MALGVLSRIFACGPGDLKKKARRLVRNLENGRNDKGMLEPLPLEETLPKKQKSFTDEYLNSSHVSGFIIKQREQIFLISFLPFYKGDLTGNK